MTIQQMLLGGAAATGYTLTRSLRFRASASANLSKTLGAGDQKTWSLSACVKRGTLGSLQIIYSAFGAFDADYDSIGFDSSDRLFVYAATVSANIRLSTQVFRDPAAFYFINVALDTSNATAGNRLRVWVNGTEITAWTTNSTIPLNQQYYFNSNVSHRFGSTSGSSLNFDGYLAETYFIDGQALTPASFGSTNALTGVWQPAPYVGTYGTNGFYLPYTDNSALTTSSNVGLGQDFSGNGNYWTTNNISITAGVTYDSMTDVPTLTSATAANYAVLNPLNAAATLNDGNMNARVTGTGGNYSVSSTIALSSGLIYFETTPYVFSLVNGQIGEFGICYATANLQSVGTRITNSGVGAGFGFGQGSSTWFSRNFGSATNLTGLSNFTTTTIAMVAINLTTGNMWVGKDGTWYNSGNPATGANPTITGIPSAQYAIGITAYQDAGLAVFQAVNFGQRPFAYTPPTGFVALNTFNL